MLLKICEGDPLIRFVGGIAPAPGRRRAPAGPRAIEAGQGRSKRLCAVSTLRARCRIQLQRSRHWRIIFYRQRSRQRQRQRQCLSLGNFPSCAAASDVSTSSPGASGARARIGSKHGHSREGAVHFYERGSWRAQLRARRCDQGARQRFQGVVERSVQWQDRREWHGTPISPDLDGDD
jgi:hypothetical protein